MAHSSESQPLPRVLVIDDDAISREVLAMLLEMRGFAVESAESGRQALGMLENWSDNDLFRMPGLILMDSQMPGLSGVELVGWMRQFSTARIIAISGSDPGREIRGATDGFLLKPIEAEDVVAMLASQDTVAVKLDASSVDAQSAGPETRPEIRPEIDPVVLGKLKAMMPAAAVREIYAAVASDLKIRLHALKAAMTEGNTTEVRRIAHTIKGGCGMVGLSRAVEASQRLESSNLPVTWVSELSELHHALGVLEGMLGSEFPS